MSYEQEIREKLWTSVLGPKSLYGERIKKPGPTGQLLYPRHRVENLVVFRYERVRVTSQNLSGASTLGRYTYRPACERSMFLSFACPPVPGGNSSGVMFFPSSLIRAKT